MTQPALFPNAQPITPHNRLGIDYRQVPPHKINLPIIDAHTHAHNVEWTKTFLSAADVYGIHEIWTMAPLEDVDPLNAAYPGRFHYIAVPKWQASADGFNETFVTDWMKRLDAFYEKGSRLVKFHMAPGTKKRWGMNLEHPLIQRVAKHAYQLGYHFMTHVGDPKAWFNPGGRYENREDFGTFAEQFEMLDHFLAQYPDRMHMGAHMGESIEDLEPLAKRLETYKNYCIDSSATKWIVRGIAEQPVEKVREFVLKFQDRILFGSDLVVGEKYAWEHYASRWWTHEMLWETSYHGESPIEDPDAPNNIPKLNGLDLPAEVLRKFYRGNALRWLPVAGPNPPAALG